MADGWRNRFMAPVYALVISFVLVLILGATLNETRIRFVLAGPTGSSDLPENFPTLDVQVQTADGTKRLDDEPLDRSREFTLLTPYDNIRICTTLPEDWSSKDRTVIETSGDFFCWGTFVQDVDVEITLVRKG